jgi:1,4-dihydroxy-2-naphthoyl-CoA synthase
MIDSTTSEEVQCEVCGRAARLFSDTEKSADGVRAFTEKRKPDFHKYVK